MLPVVSARNTTSPGGGVAGVVWLLRNFVLPPAGTGALIEVIIGGSIFNVENRVTAAFPDTSALGSVLET
jgi:hypothetical protein